MDAYLSSCFRFNTMRDYQYYNDARWMTFDGPQPEQLPINQGPVLKDAIPNLPQQSGAQYLPRPFQRNPSPPRPPLLPSPLRSLERYRNNGPYNQGPPQQQQQQQHQQQRQPYGHRNFRDQSDWNDLFLPNFEDPEDQDYSYRSTARISQPPPKKYRSQERCAQQRQWKQKPSRIQSKSNEVNKSVLTKEKIAYCSPSEVVSKQKIADFSPTEVLSKQKISDCSPTLVLSKEKIADCSSTEVESKEKIVVFREAKDPVFINVVDILNLANELSAQNKQAIVDKLDVKVSKSTQEEGNNTTNTTVNNNECISIAEIDTDITTSISNNASCIDDKREEDNTDIPKETPITDSIAAILTQLSSNNGSEVEEDEPEQEQIYTAIATDIPITVPTEAVLLKTPAIASVIVDTILEEETCDKSNITNDELAAVLTINRVPLNIEPNYAPAETSTVDLSILTNLDVVPTKVVAESNSESATIVAETSRSNQINVIHNFPANAPDKDSRIDHGKNITLNEIIAMVSMKLTSSDGEKQPFSNKQIKCIEQSSAAKKRRGSDETQSASKIPNNDVMVDKNLLSKKRRKSIAENNWVNNEKSFELKNISENKIKTSAIDKNEHENSAKVRNHSIKIDSRKTSKTDIDKNRMDASKDPSKDVKRRKKDRGKNTDVNCLGLSDKDNIQKKKNDVSKVTTIHDKNKLSAKPEESKKRRQSLSAEGENVLDTTVYPQKKWKRICTDVPNQIMKLSLTSVRDDVQKPLKSNISNQIFDRDETDLCDREIQEINTKSATVTSTRKPRSPFRRRSKSADTRVESGGVVPAKIGRTRRKTIYDQCDPNDESEMRPRSNSKCRKSNYSEDPDFVAYVNRATTPVRVTRSKSQERQLISSWKENDFLTITPDVFQRETPPLVEIAAIERIDSQHPENVDTYRSKVTMENARVFSIGCSDPRLKRTGLDDDDINTDVDDITLQNTLANKIIPPDFIYPKTLTESDIDRIHNTKLVLKKLTEEQIQKFRKKIAAKRKAHISKPSEKLSCSIAIDKKLLPQLKKGKPTASNNTITVDNTDVLSSVIMQMEPPTKKFEDALPMFSQQYDVFDLTDKVRSVDNSLTVPISKRNEKLPEDPTMSTKHFDPFAPMKSSNEETPSKPQEKIIQYHKKMMNLFGNEANEFAEGKGLPKKQSPCLQRPGPQKARSIIEIPLLPKTAKNKEKSVRKEKVSSINNKSKKKEKDMPNILEEESSIIIPIDDLLEIDKMFPCEKPRQKHGVSVLDPCTITEQYQLLPENIELPLFYTEEVTEEPNRVSASASVNTIFEPPEVISNAYNTSARSSDEGALSINDHQNHPKREITNVRLIDMDHRIIETIDLSTKDEDEDEDKDVNKDNKPFIQPESIIIVSVEEYADNVCGFIDQYIILKEQVTGFQSTLKKSMSTFMLKIIDSDKAAMDFKISVFAAIGKELVNYTNSVEIHDFNLTVLFKTIVRTSYQRNRVVITILATANAIVELYEAYGELAIKNASSFSKQLYQLSIHLRGLEAENSQESPNRNSICEMPSTSNVINTTNSTAPLLSSTLISTTVGDNTANKSAAISTNTTVSSLYPKSVTKHVISQTSISHECPNITPTSNLQTAMQPPKYSPQLQQAVQSHNVPQILPLPSMQLASHRYHTQLPADVAVPTPLHSALVDPVGSQSQQQAPQDPLSVLKNYKPPIVSLASSQEHAINIGLTTLIQKQVEIYNRTVRLATTYLQSSNHLQHMRNIVTAQTCVPPTRSISDIPSNTNITTTIPQATSKRVGRGRRGSNASRTSNARNEGYTPPQGNVLFGTTTPPAQNLSMQPSKILRGNPSRSSCASLCDPMRTSIAQPPTYNQANQFMQQSIHTSTTANTITQISNSPLLQNQMLVGHLHAKSPAQLPNNRGTITVKDLSQLLEPLSSSEESIDLSRPVNTNNVNFQCYYVAEDTRIVPSQSTIDRIDDINYTTTKEATQTCIDQMALIGAIGANDEEESIPRNRSTDSGVGEDLVNLEAQELWCNWCKSQANVVCDCKLVVYCSASCQEYDWNVHRQQHDKI